MALPCPDPALLIAEVERNVLELVINTPELQSLLREAKIFPGSLERHSPQWNNMVLIAVAYQMGVQSARGEHDQPGGEA